jgi:hypothetical protein
MDELFTYAGRIIVAEETAEPAETVSGPFDAQTATPAQAHAEAAAIIAAALEEADEIKSRKFAGMEMEFERRLAERLTSVAREFNFGIAECGAILAEILSDALLDIVGNTRSPDLLMKAIVKASSKHTDKQSLTVLVSPDDHPRLEVLRLGIPEVKSIRTVADASIEKGRCVLNAGGKRYDVSLDAQINAFRQQAHKLVAGMSASGAASGTGSEGGVQ